MRKIVSVAPAIVVLLVTVVTIAAAPSAIRNLQVAQTRANISLAQQRLDDNDILKRMSDAVADLSEVVEPSVVHIDAYSSRGRRGPISSGSGWVYNDSGHIITNAHVIRGADRYTVQYHDGYTVVAEFVGLDSPTDVGVIKVDPDSGAIPLDRASGRVIRQGERVYAFGSPFGFRFSMSEGIVSATGRNAFGVTGANGYTNFIQTDAAVNPGNSGGPLVDAQARVIGMNTAIVSAGNPNADIERQGQSAGIGFAIPLDTIESVADQIIETGIVVKGYLGISLTESDDWRIRDELPEGFRGSGVVVLGAVEGQPAARAGLRAGDIIVGVNGERTPDSAVLRAKIGSARPGDTVQLTIVRGTDDGYEEVQIPVEIGAAVVDARNSLIAVPEGQDPAEVYARVTIDVERVDEGRSMLARAGVRDFNFTADGELRVMVQPDSPADAAGLKPTDTVVRFGDTNIRSNQDLLLAIEQLAKEEPAQRVRLTLRDDSGALRDVDIPLENE